jgi:cholest-4-en-3-one 26-monooxygenase
MVDTALATTRPINIDFNDLDRFPAECREWFRWLRAHEPLSWHPGPADQQGDGTATGYWCLVRYADLKRAHREWERLSSEGADGPGSEIGGDAIRDMTRDEGVGTMMILTDPPKHTAYRKLVNRGFTPRSIAALEPRLRAITRAAVDAVATRGSCDFVQDFAAMLPLQAICELLGVPDDERLQLVEWTNSITSPSGGDLSTVRAQVADARQRVFEYAAELGARKRANPEADLTSRILLGEVTLADGTEHRLSEFEFEMFMLLLIFAGNETTRSAVSGAMVAFAAYPEQWARLLEDRDLIPTGVEEILRFVSPVASMRRTVTSEIEFQGRRLQRGERVVMWYPAANRDEEVFGSDAERFDVGRSPNEHMAFGANGPHFCLGAWLARLEIRLTLEELTARLPDIQVSGAPTYARSNLILGPLHLPVTFSARG